MNGRKFSLPRWRSNNPVLQEALNVLAASIEDALNREVVPGRNMLWSDDGITMILESIGEGGDDEPTSDSFAFDISFADNNGTTKAFFVEGSAQNLVPENVGEPVNLSGGDVSYAILRINADGTGEVQDCTLMIQATKPDSPKPIKNGLPTQVDVLLHMIKSTPGSNGGTPTYNSVRIFYPKSNVWLTPYVAFQTPVTDSQPGGPRFDNWFNWKIGGS